MVPQKMKISMCYSKYQCPLTGVKLLNPQCLLEDVGVVRYPQISVSLGSLIAHSPTEVGCVPLVFNIKNISPTRARDARECTWYLRRWKYPSESPKLHYIACLGVNERAILECQLLQRK